MFPRGALWSGHVYVSQIETVVDGTKFFPLAQVQHMARFRFPFLDTLARFPKTLRSRPAARPRKWRTGARTRLARRPAPQSDALQPGQTGLLGWLLRAR